MASEVDDNFSKDEKTLILETLSEYAQLLGGDESLKRNLALTEIKQDWSIVTLPAPTMHNTIILNKLSDYNLVGIAQL